MVDTSQRPGGDGRPKMCPSCNKLIGLERVCPYCGADSGSVAGRVRAASRDSGPAVSVTGVLVVVNLVVYALTLAIGGSESSEGAEFLKPDHGVLLRFGLQHPFLVDAGEWWRLVLPIFLHLGALHLLMNTLVLWVTGRHLEADIGGRAFFFMYIASGVVGFAASQVMEIGGGGASGAVAGILGCTIVKRRLSDGNFRHPVTMQAIQLVVLNALFGMAVSKVNNTAHLGGLLTGAALGVPFALLEGRRLASRLWTGGAALMGAGVLASVVALVVSQPPAGRAELQRAARCADQARTAIDATGTTVMPGPALEALRCLDAIPPIDPEPDALLGKIKRGLARARDGRLEGSTSLEQRGLDELVEGILALDRWLGANPRWLMP